ncbi:hypothetical protein DPEC_G00333720 [Dallia pectoralis]|uniref:Uncharacterized protein n=1 Tax=Dallia pectoralis TaxID=75939 RepID=A0ACC2F6J1_DALPE|nr:hypothetical protein DPEC_G00333720 [Dallia pectoralis]
MEPIGVVTGGRSKGVAGGMLSSAPIHLYRLFIRHEQGVALEFVFVLYPCLFIIKSWGLLDYGEHLNRREH